MQARYLLAVVHFTHAIVVSVVVLVEEVVDLLIVLPVCPLALLTPRHGLAVDVVEVGDILFRVQGVKLFKQGVEVGIIDLVEVLDEVIFGLRLVIIILLLLQVVIHFGVALLRAVVVLELALRVLVHLSSWEALSVRCARWKSKVLSNALKWHKMNSIHILLFFISLELLEAAFFEWLQLPHHRLIMRLRSMVAH